MLIVYFIFCFTFYLFIHFISLFLLQPHEAQMLECRGRLCVYSVGTDVTVHIAGRWPEPSKKPFTSESTTLPSIETLANTT